MFIFALASFIYRFLTHTSILLTVIISGLTTSYTQSKKKMWTPTDAQHRKQLARISAENLRNLNIIARTVYGEARDQKTTGRKAVAHVILNRAKHASHNIPRTIYKRKQFSCWNHRDPNRKILESQNINSRVFNKILIECLEAMDEKDTTNGASHYHIHRISPYWKKSSHLHRTTKIGAHIFYKTC